MSCAAAGGGYAFASPGEAVRAMCDRLSPVGVESVRPSAARGRVLAQRLVTDRDSPAADVSAMDGWAVRAAGAGAAALRVTGESRAGFPPPPMATGQAVRINTGAIVPNGADAVVPLEHAQEHQGLLDLRGVRVESGQHVRRTGENAPKGAPVLEAGSLLTPAAVAAAASFHPGDLQVRRRVRAEIVVTGDEVVYASDSGGAGELPAWRLRDSHGPALSAMMGSAPWVELGSVAHVRDDASELEQALWAAMERCDMLVVTGGVSMGGHDLVPGALAACGVETVFHRLPQRPGKPMLGGVTRRRQAVLALPGNPVSAMVTLRRIGREVAAGLAGLNLAPPPLVRLRNGGGKKLDLWWHRAAKLVDTGIAEPGDGRGSGDVVSVAASDGFVEIPPQQGGEGPWAFYAWPW